jgi:hypothetical protein
LHHFAVYSTTELSSGAGFIADSMCDSLAAGAQAFKRRVAQDVRMSIMGNPASLKAGKGLKHRESNT